MSKTEFIKLLTDKRKEYEKELNAAYHAGLFDRYERYEHYIDIIDDILIIAPDISSLE